MKKILSVVIILIAFVAIPLKSYSQLRYGATAGATLSSLNFKQDLVGVSDAVGYTAGIQGELMFPGIGLGLDIGLLYNQLGAKVNLGDRKVWSSLGYGNERVYLHYVQVPFHLRFKWTKMNGLEERIAPFVYFGPDLTLLAAHGNCDAFDYAGGEVGLTAGFGFEILQKWQISAAYTWGLTYSLKTKLLDDFSARNRHWAVRLTYFFD